MGDVYIVDGIYTIFFRKRLEERTHRQICSILTLRQMKKPETELEIWCLSQLVAGAIVIKPLAQYGGRHHK